MATQLLGANAALNTPGGSPGAAPTVLQGGLVVGAGGATIVGNETVNGTLTVVQPQGGGTRTAYFTDGNSGVAENSVGIFSDQTSTQFQFTDSGVQASLTFEGTALPSGQFGLTKPLRLGGILGEGNLYAPAGLNNLRVGSILESTELTVVRPGGGGARALNITDSEAGVLGNSVEVFLNQGNTFISIVDNGVAGQLSFDGANGANGSFVVDKPVQFPAVQCGRAVSILSGTLVPVVGMTNASIVIATQVQVLGETEVPFFVDPEPIVGATPAGITFVFAGGGTKTFNWFVARL